MIKPVSAWVDYSSSFTPGQTRYGSILALCDNGQVYRLGMYQTYPNPAPVWETVGPPIPGTEADLAQQQEE